MDFKNFISGLTPTELDEYACRAGTTALYIRTHLVKPRKIPRPPLMQGLLAASDGVLTGADLMAHFNILGEKNQASEATPPEDRRTNPSNAASQKTGEAGGSTTRRTAPTAGSGEVIERAA
ncbi:hypothetical protein MishRS11D_02800 [Methylomagnum ishizawai]|nr:hypothetical protein MishRS11D_02800 [Methylomagnum ishizawai]